MTQPLRKLAIGGVTAVVLAGGAGVAVHQYAQASALPPIVAQASADTATTATTAADPPTTASATSAATTTATSTGTHTATAGWRGGPRGPRGGPNGGPALKSVLDQLVTQGKITSAQEQDIITAMQAYQQSHASQRLGLPLFQAEWQAAAKALNLTPAQLQTDTRGGKSVASIAQSQGVALQTVENAMIAAAKAQLDQDVSSGKITAAQENTLLTNLQSHLAQLLNATPGKGHAVGPTGPHNGAAPQKPAA